MAGPPTHHVSVWTRATHVANVVVWRLPLPHRARAALSALVYRNPPIDAARVNAVLIALAAAGVEAWCAGGWGVDALAGTQSRAHGDLDLLVDRTALAAALAALRGLGFEDWYRISDDRWMGERVVVRDRSLRVVDVHPVDLADPRAASEVGTIGGRPTLCLSVGTQHAAHAGYRKRVRDRHDLRILRRLVDGAPSALVIPVPEADALVAENARDPGMPAHVSVLYPFLTTARMGADVEATLADACASVPAFAFALREVRTFPGVVYLAPDPPGPFVALTEAIVSRWPDHEPYGGAYDEIVPHVTVGYGDAIDPRLSAALPLEAHAGAVWLMTRSGRRWVQRATLPLGPAEARK